MIDPGDPSKKQKPINSKKRICWFLRLCHQYKLNSFDLQKQIAHLIKTDLLDRHVVYKSDGNSSAEQLLFYPKRFAKRDMQKPFMTKTYVWKYDEKYHCRIETKHYYFKSKKKCTNPEIIYHETNNSLIFPRKTIFHLKMPTDVKEYFTDHLETPLSENTQSKNTFFGLIGTLPWYGSGLKWS